jgi:hypothetical protein
MWRNQSMISIKNLFQKCKEFATCSEFGQRRVACNHSSSEADTHSRTANRRLGCQVSVPQHCHNVAFKQQFNFARFQAQVKVHTRHWAWSVLQLKCAFVNPGCMYLPSYGRSRRSLSAYIQTGATGIDAHVEQKNAVARTKNGVLQFSLKESRTWT